MALVTHKLWSEKHPKSFSYLPTTQCTVQTIPKHGSKHVSYQDSFQKRYLPFCQLNNEIILPMSKSHYGVSVVVPVYEELVSPETTCQPCHCYSWQSRGILQNAHVLRISLYDMIAYRNEKREIPAEGYSLGPQSSSTHRTAGKSGISTFEAYLTILGPTERQNAFHILYIWMKCAWTFVLWCFHCWYICLYYPVSPFSSENGTYVYPVNPQECLDEV